MLKVTESIDCNLSTEEIIGLHKQDVSLRKWWEEAQESKIENRNERKTVFEIKNGLLWRRKAEESREVRQLVAGPKILRNCYCTLSNFIPLPPSPFTSPPPFPFPSPLS